MDRYSLLRLKPHLFTTTSNKISTHESLYKLLDGATGCRKGKRVVSIDGSIQREYLVTKYERYKAGLMARVWLKREGKDDGEAVMIGDEDALGLKWKLL